MGVKRWIVTLFVLALVAGSLVLLLLQSGADEILIERVLPRVEQRLGVSLEFEEVDVSLTSVALHRVTVRPAGGTAPLATVDRVGVGVRVGPLLLGEIDLTGVRLEGVELLVGAGVGGASVEQWREVARRLAEGGGAVLGSGSGGGALEINLVSGGLAAEHGGFRLAIGGISGLWSPGAGGSLVVDELDLSHRGRGVVTQASGRVLAGGNGSRTKARRLAIDLDRPEIEIPASREGLTALARDAHRLVRELAGAEGEAPDAGVDAVPGLLSPRLGIHGARIVVSFPEHPERRFVLEDVEGEVAVDAPIPLSVRAEGRLPGTDARFSLAARRPGGDEPTVLELEVPDLPLGEIGTLLPADWPVDWDRASADGTLAVELVGGGEKIAIRGQVNLSGLGLRHERVAASALAALAAHTDFKITWDRAEGVVHVERLLVSRGRAHFTLRGDVRTDRLAFDARLNLPSTACRHVLGAIPPELRAGPGEVQLEGSFGLDLRVAVDVDAPGDTVLEAELDNRCRIGEWGDLPAPDQYRRPFTYLAYDGRGERFRLVTGPGTDRWTPLAQISPYLVEAALTTEDGKFRAHSGVTVPELRRAIELNLRHRSLTHGASTITMQLAKNLFLSRDRTLDRKLQELFYVWYLESFFGKDEILELYFNIVEFGPSIYGIRDAATHYFGREPHELSLAESVFLIKLLPSPVIRHAAYERGEVSERKMTSLHRVMRTMRARGRITEAELQEGLAQAIEFHREGEPLPAPRLPPERDGFRLSPSGDYGDYEPEETEASTWESETE
jgi:hypothetical protein